jgi:hypothetical protein
MTTQQSLSNNLARTPNSNEPLILKGRWLTAARIGWLVISISTLGLFIMGVPLRFQELMTACTGELCAANQLTPEAISQLPSGGLTPSGYATLMVGSSIFLLVVYGGVGLLIFLLRSNERMALMSSLWLVTFGATLWEGEVRAMATAYPGLQLPVTFLIVTGGIILLHLFLFIFPNGRFVPKWSRWVWLISGFVFTSIGMAALRPDGQMLYEEVGQPIWMLMLLFGIGTQIYRYKSVSRPGERQQTKWVMSALLLTFLVISGILLSWAFLPGNRDPGIGGAVAKLIPNLIGSIAFSVIPLGIGFSILRYRLWDIDIIIRRTVQYVVVTAVLLLIYFGSVTLLQNALTGLTGSQSPLVIVLSTLLIAALFNPLRTRVQAFIDRRFYRNKYDAAQMLARFAQTAQEEVDMERISAALVAVVEETMQPEQTSLWLKQTKGIRQT